MKQSLFPMNPNLPSDFPHEPPEGYSYSVTEHRKNMLAIWIINHGMFSYTDTPPQSIWGFYSRTKKCYHAPINSTRHGDKVDISNTRAYTAMQLNLNPLEAAFFS
jgi:hypothetical protein